jgi:alpha-galactosidase
MTRLGILLIYLLTLGTPVKADERQMFDRFLTDAGLKPIAAAPTTAARMESATQDFSRLSVNLSCHTHTPLRIGETTYAEGLGTHANSRIVFRLHSPQKAFVAEVGIDNNADTRSGAAKASVVFVVKGDGRELARTPVCRWGQPPRRIKVSLENVQTLELLVTDAGDGIAYDQADWADARLIAADGKSHPLSQIVTQGGSILSQAGLPASFVYGGTPSGELLRKWPRVAKPPVETESRQIHEITWTEPGDGLAATWHAEVFKDRPAVEFRWIFANHGGQPIKPLTDVFALDLRSADMSGIRLVHSSGGLTGPFTGEPAAFIVTESELKSAVTLSAAGGRSSNKDLPFFVLHDAAAASGIFVGIGWSGQWQADFRTDAASGHLRITAGMPGMNLALPAGQTIRSPSILLGVYHGDAQAGGNALRRILYDHYVALLGDRKPLPPVSWNHWFTFQNNISEDMLKRQIDAAADLGLEYFCIDSGWFDGGFPDGVGNWTLDRTKFPHGLGPVGEYAAAKGMKLGLWFEPTRAASGTRLTREHPNWVFGGQGQVAMEIPAARQWLFDMMCHFIDEGHVAWIRYDYNHDPLVEWDARDKPETRGLTQIRYLQGEYEFFDRLRQKYPRLLIESCASGGRRIDLETIRRAHTFWKSDETGNLIVARSQETGGNRFLPGVLLNTNLPASTPTDHFYLRSLFAGPLGFALDWTRLDAAGRQQVRQEIAAYKAVRHLLDKDYYPLFPQTFDLTDWVGWEFYDPAAGDGFVVFLRPAESPYAAAEVRLCELDATKMYRVTRLDGSQPRDLSGRELASGLKVSLGVNQSEALRFQRKAAK